MRLTKTKRETYLAAADVCRNLQQVYAAKAKGKYRAMWSDHAGGAGGCAVELELLAGLSFDEITKRKRVRAIDRSKAE